MYALVIDPVAKLFRAIIVTCISFEYRILKDRRYLSTDEILVWILIIGAIRFCLDLSFKKFSQVMMPWASEARS